MADVYLSLEELVLALLDVSELGVVMALLDEGEPRADVRRDAKESVSH